MPIMVNMPGNGLDTAGQGVAAAQAYQANEQKARIIDEEAAQRAQAFDLEKQVTLRSLEMKEEQATFEREQLAQAQAAEADALLGMAVEAGLPVGDQERYRAIMQKTSPEFRRDMARELGRSMRLRAEQQELEEITASLELTPDTAARVQSGELTEPAAIRRAQAKEKTMLARGEHQEMQRQSVVENWQAWTKDPSFDMPDETDEAYDDVMRLLGEVGPGAATNTKTNYGLVWNQLRFLTTKGMREAALDLLQKEMGGLDAAGLPRGALVDAASDETFQRDAYANKAQGDRAEANAAMKPTGRPGAPAAPSERLKQPMPERLAGAENEQELAAEVRRVLHQDFGITAVPEPGTPEYRIAERVIESVRARLAEVEQTKAAGELESSKRRNAALERGQK